MRSKGPKRNKMEPHGIAGGQQEITVGCLGFLTPSCPGLGLSSALAPLLNVSHNGRQQTKSPEKVPGDTGQDPPDVHMDPGCPLSSAYRVCRGHTEP